MKKIIILIFLIFCFNHSAQAFCDIYSAEYLNQYKNYIMIRQRFDAINYNVLGLSPEQIEKYEDITKSEKTIYQEKLSEINHELEKYQIMKDCNLPSFEIQQQKHHIKELYKELSRISRSEKRKLKKILTKEQRKTYNTIKHLERHDLKSDMQPKNFHKLNPKMSIFGNLQE